MSRSSRPERRRQRHKFVPVHHVYTNGEVTEFQYFRSLAKIYKGKAVIKVTAKGGIDPSRLVDYAAERIAREPKLGGKGAPAVSNWAVYDQDEFSNAQIETARTKAKKCDLGAILSSPCFEFWLLLHFEDRRAPMKAGDCQLAYQKHDENYSHHYRPVANFDLLVDRIEMATQRAREIHNERNNDPSCDFSYTDMWLVLEELGS